MSNEFKSADRVEDTTGRQYHIGLAPGELATNILTVGDAARAERLAKRFDEGSIRTEKRNREYVTFTGTYQGMEISVMATGMGADNTEIAMVELSQIVENPILIRVGTCGGLQDYMRLEDLVISTGAVRLENTTTYFVHEGYPAVAHFEVVAALRDAAVELGKRHHLGITATAPGFYGAQCRQDSGFTPRFPNLIDELAAMNVKNLEMETSALLTMAALKDYRVGAICTVFAERPHGNFVAKDRKVPAEDAALDTALLAFKKLQ
ncbi:MAG: nucleoside phosphorylase [Planctomycetota bacterium]